jgi:hypothetical protein
MPAIDTTKSGRTMTAGFCRECNSYVHLSRGDGYYACLCGSESATSFYVPFTWVLNERLAANPVATVEGAATQAARAASVKSHR